MPVIRVDNYLDAYRLKSQAEDVHEMAARPDKKHLTDFVNRRILDVLQPRTDDLVVDIGCGDGSLLCMVGDNIRSLGIVATIEEERRLRSVYPGLSIKAGDMRSLPIESGVASRIVCNATLIYLPSEIAVRAALCEMKRIARPDSIILLGEIPEIDEYRHHGIYRGHSMVAFVWHSLRRNGLRAFAGMMRRWFRAVFAQEQIVLNSAGIFYATPEKMVKLAESCGLILKTYFRHKEVDLQGNVTDSSFRYDYLFTV